MDTIKVRTTQNVEVEYQVASIGDRVLAHIIDYAIFFGWGIIASAIVVGLQSITYSPIVFFLLFLPVVFYDPVCEIFLNGQSIGKKARDIKVIKLSGEAPTVVDYLLRWLFRLVDTLLSSGIIAVVTVAATGSGQRLGDLAAGTAVIRTKPVTRQHYVRVKVEENHVRTFEEVSLLTDKDVALIRKLLYKALKYQNQALLDKLADRTKEVMGVQTTLDNATFLKTVIKDYYHQSLELEATV
ncbi:RDD family protein [Pontibacter sp. SGAir0037]|uniref:RDD family protein n=1 Tax=Pontibacter sp. SGAir0037 TaxID=2571030 RepID=UPI0010CD3E37|nr:RDD family protein [Pontibacter sp. SGAir0037]QCR22684.1 RDD family protein [Pontibacter sp. SGAir0037]